MGDPGRERTRVLVVDDEELIAATLSLILQRHGYETRSAYSGEQALDELDRFRPDILITDVVMPGINGLKLARSVAMRYPGCRIILLTGHANHFDFTTLRSAEVTFEVIAKPAHPQELLNTLRVRGATATLRTATALVVDDFEPHRYSVGRLLKTSGFRVLEASSGQECMQKVDESPDVIVLDIHLPDTNGFDVCRRLRSRPATATTPILHLSATAKNPEAREESRLVGANDYVTSPFDPEDLLGRLRSLVQVHMLAREQRHDNNHA